MLWYKWLTQGKDSIVSNLFEFEESLPKSWLLASSLGHTPYDMILLSTHSFVRTSLIHYIWNLPRIIGPCTNSETLDHFGWARLVNIQNLPNVDENTATYTCTAFCQITLTTIPCTFWSTCINDLHHCNIDSFIKNTVTSPLWAKHRTPRLSFPVCWVAKSVAKRVCHLLQNFQ